MTAEDQTTREFIRAVCSDPDLDYRLDRLLALFALPMPATHGGYGHHVTTDGLCR